MSIGFEHAYLWHKGRSSLHNPYTLAMESVMTGAGEVFFGLLSDSGDLAGRAVVWFYEDALVIIRDYGICAYLRSSFQRKVGRKYAGYFCMFLCHGRKKIILSRGEDFDAVKLRHGGLYLGTKNLSQMLGLAKMTEILNGTVQRNDVSKEISSRLGEFARRCQSRGLDESMCAMVIVRKKKSVFEWLKGRSR